MNNSNELSAKSTFEGQSGFPTLTILDQKSIDCVVVEFNEVPYELVQEIANHVRRQLPKQIQARGFELASALLSIHFKISGTSGKSALVNMAVGYSVEEDQPNAAELSPAVSLELPDNLAQLLVANEAKRYTLPAGRVAVLSHYHQKDEGSEPGSKRPVLFAAWEKMLTRITDRGLSPLAPMWEVYAPGRTDLFVPLGWSTPPAP